jgi:signal peptidase II
MNDRVDADLMPEDQTPETPEAPEPGEGTQPGETFEADEPFEAGHGGPGARRHLRLAALALATAVTVILLDQLTKYIAVRELTGRGPVDVIDGLFQFRLLRNSGAAFSFATGMTWVLTAVSATVCTIIVRYAFRLGSAWWALALGLMLGGAIGNLFDRFLRAPGFARGHVVDFMELPHWPVFNVADSAVVTGAVLIGILGFLGIGLDGRRQRA